jgi:hypothetical protein
LTCNRGRAARRGPPDGGSDRTGDPRREPIDTQLDKLMDAMKPWSAEGGYYNYAERPCDVDAILPEETCKRLEHVKRSWDPDDLIRANHAIALATG